MNTACIITNQGRRFLLPALCDVIDFNRFESLPWLQERTILLTVHGSRAYGLHTESSDYDYKGVAIPPRSYFTGFLQRFEQAEQKSPADATIYDIRKFFHLAADCNPNVIEVLWTDDSDLVMVEPAGHALREMRGNFLSLKAKYTFSGYAIAQLKRIRTHRKWLLTPPKKKPERADFNLPERTLVSKDMMGAIQAVLDAGGSPLQYGQNVMQAYEKERSYHNAMHEWHQYETWKQSRNPVRAELEAKFGYDCKHAMHLVRLMRMCREILTTGKVLVKRPDREELLRIRNGAWEYDQLIEWAESQDSELEAIAQSSALPHAPDRVLLDQKCRFLVESVNWPTI